MQVASTPNQIEYFRLASCKAAVKLEALGMRHNGRSVTSQMREELGLSPRASRKTIVNAILARMEELKNGTE